MGPEEVDIVDELDEVRGSANLRQCLEEGLLHRAVAVLVERGGGKFLLQQRSKADLWQPGKWTLSCTGHVKKGESYDEAARRELDEELGLKARLTLVAKVIIPPITEGALTEREWVGLYRAWSDVVLRIDPVELEQVKEVSSSELRRLARAGSLTADAKILLRRFLQASDF